MTITAIPLQHIVRFASDFAFSMTDDLIEHTLEH